MFARISTSRSYELAIHTALTRQRELERKLVEFSLFGLPQQAQSLFRTLVVIPAGVFLLVVLRNLVGQPAVLDKEIARNGKLPRWRVNHMANIAKPIQIFGGGNKGLSLHLVGGEKVTPTRRMHAQRQDHRRWLRRGIGKLVSGSDLYRHIACSLA